MSSGRPARSRSSTTTTSAWSRSAASSPGTAIRDTDEFFLVLSGSLTIKLDGEAVVLAPGDSYVVPRGTYHQPIAPTETAILLFEPRETVNTGDTPGELTAERRVF